MQKWCYNSVMYRPHHLSGRLALIFKFRLAQVRYRQYKILKRGLYVKSRRLSRGLLVLYPMREHLAGPMHIYSFATGRAL